MSPSLWSRALDEGLPRRPAANDRPEGAVMRDLGRKKQLADEDESHDGLILPSRKRVSNGRRSHGSSTARRSGAPRSAMRRSASEAVDGAGEG